MSRFIGDERKLPVWAQELIERLRDDLSKKDSEINGLRTAHAILVDGREWFTISGPTFDTDHETRRLWFLDREHPFPACSLGKGDLLLVGRAKNEERKQ